MVNATYGFCQEGGDVDGAYLVALHLLQVVGHRVRYNNLVQQAVFDLLCRVAREKTVNRQQKHLPKVAEENGVAKVAMAFQWFLIYYRPSLPHAAIS